MKIRVIGGGWYGCHLATVLGAPEFEGAIPRHQVELHEQSHQLFNGASGANPARLHAGFHYPRSWDTRHASRMHASQFMGAYGHLTRAVPVNLYAVAADDSLLCYRTYRTVMQQSNLEFVQVTPADFGLQNIEGALLTGERHIVIDDARAWFEEKLDGAVRFGAPYDPEEGGWDLTIDCTFCSLDAGEINRYEPCLIPLLRGPTDRALTIMDGPFPSLYPWNEMRGLSSLSSALHTPLRKDLRTHAEAVEVLQTTSIKALRDRANAMFDHLCSFYPAARGLYEIVDLRTSVRAMPRSGADARLCTVVDAGDRVLRVRPGKIDAIFEAERQVHEQVCRLEEQR